MHFVLVFAEAVSIGVASYIFGLVPLGVKSQSRLSLLTDFGNGQLYGVAWSLIFVKMAMGAASTLLPQQFGISRAVVALSDMGGMLFMWMANRRISARLLDAHLRPEPQADREKYPDAVARPAVVLDSTSTPASRTTPAVGPRQQRIYLFTLSLLIQLVINGIINGYRATDIHHTVKSTKLNENTVPVPSLDNLSHYLNALFENALMTFTLSTTLRSASFPIARCKQHLIAAAVAMPLAEMFSYTVITVIEISAAQFEVFPLLALRSFTDGMFIYAVFVLRYALTGAPQAKWGRRWIYPLSLAGSCMSTVGPKLVLIPISAFLKLVHRYS
ncbi:hypothetical protein V8D89_004080 [Ganoderma adspersum]